MDNDPGISTIRYSLFAIKAIHYSLFAIRYYEYYC